MHDSEKLFSEYALIAEALLKLKEKSFIEDEAVMRELRGLQGVMKELSETLTQLQLVANQRQTATQPPRPRLYLVKPLPNMPFSIVN
ncbi:hypothetical protein PsdCFBP2356_04955 [Pseudomonas syringae pv. dysoxyli]|uniref:hypothetical protein n=1 Tax=Pseudomonas syringae TaxID=317 RepID=UPI001372C8EE|nr:hypothetical protein [Pseudomonas syringae]NAO25930.1 hypothetical protein [Pseudomonas syringae pv. dysoxyli]